MSLTPSEKKHAEEVAWDMDLMTMARELVNMEDTSFSTQLVLEAVHSEYQGGITQFYLQNRF
jgi:hypothetical protein